MAATLAPNEVELLLGLAVTERCCSDDLNEDPDESLEAMAARKDVVAKFIDLRSQDEEGQERIQAIRAHLPVFSLHAGRQRAATTPDSAYSVVWLLGTKIHRAGERTDSYSHFVRLHEQGNLLPTESDYERLLNRRNAQAVPLMISRAVAGLAAARDRAGESQTVLLPGGVVLTLLVDREPPGEHHETIEQIWMAVSAHGLAKGMLGLIQAALTPGPAPNPWEYVQDFPGRGPDRGELRFRCWHEVHE